MRRWGIAARWQCPAGYYGWGHFAVRRRGHEFYFDDGENRLAVFATATLTEDMGHSTPGMAAANFGSGNEWWQGQDTNAPRPL